MKGKDVEEKISHLLQGRLAHIQIQTIHQLVNHQDKKKSQWDVINEQLQQLKSLGADYRAA
ncbi:hypothetical protein PCANC_25839, partial [Puccinia coronata f. sp. avenae]